MIAAVLDLHEGAGAALDGVDHVAGGFAHGENVVDARFLQIVDAEIRKRPVIVRLSFSSLPSTRSTSAIPAKPAGSVWAAQPVTTILRFGVLAARLADRLPGLAHRFGGHRAGVEDDGAVLQRGKPAASASRRITSDS